MVVNMQFFSCYKNIEIYLNLEFVFLNVAKRNDEY